MTDIVVLRPVNIFYYVCFLIYIILVVIFIAPKRKEQPYKNAFRIFLCTSVVLIAMEFAGYFTWLREFHIGDEINPLSTLILQNPL